MTVREATAADADRVLALIRTIPELPQWSRSALATGEAMRPGEPRRRLLVAEEESRVLGFAQTVVVLGEAELESMAVAEVCRGQGTGGRLLRRAIEMARADGAEVLRLEVRQGNTAAQRLYERAGMTAAGVRREYYRDPVEDAVLMEVRWPEGSGAAERSPYPLL